MEAGLLLIFIITGFIMGRMTVRSTEAPKRRYSVISSPRKALKERKQIKAEIKELEKYTAIMENIENYDGTGANQQNVPL